jgi:acyl-coenzyme A synthetase/AMP-(fatty) acid ligase
MTEISTYVSFSPGRPPVPGRTGYPQPGRRVAILPESGGEAPVDRGAEGLLAVSRRDPGLMLGYWRRPEETAAAFRGAWFITGDRARMDPDGAIEYLGRADDLINAGGFRVSPQEIEAALAAHPGVAEAAAVEREVRPGVRIVAAFYVPKAGPLPEDELAAHCAARLARYKLPRAFHPVEALPKDANGKLVRRRLREAPPP